MTGRACARDRERNTRSPIKSKEAGTRFSWPRVVIQVMSKNFVKREWWLLNEREG